MPARPKPKSAAVVGSGTCCTTKLLVNDAESAAVRMKSSLIPMFATTAGPGWLGIGVPKARFGMLPLRNGPPAENDCGVTVEGLHRHAVDKGRVEGAPRGRGDGRVVVVVVGHAALDRPADQRRRQNRTRRQREDQRELLGQDGVQVRDHDGARDHGVVVEGPGPKLSSDRSPATIPEPLHWESDISRGAPEVHLVVIPHRTRHRRRARARRSQPKRKWRAKNSNRKPRALLLPRGRTPPWSSPSHDAFDGCRSSPAVADLQAAFPGNLPRNTLNWKDSLEVTAR